MRTVQAREQNGFSTIELLFAFALATIFLSGAALIAFGGQTASLDVSLTGHALRTVSTQIGKAIASTTTSWHELLPTQSGFYTQENRITHVSPCLQDLESSTLWATEHGREQHVALSTSLGSTKEAKAHGGGCDPFAPIDRWDNPRAAGSVTVPGVKGTGIAVRSIHNRLYVFTTARADDETLADFIVIDSSDAEHPSIVGTSLSSFKGLNSIAIGGSYAYVLNNDNVTQLRVIDISDPAVPYEVVLAARTLPNIVSTCSPPSACLSGRSIAYFDGRLYIGTSYIAFGTTVQNHELHVYCVGDGVTPGCAPENPQWLGSFNVNRNVNDIEVRTVRVGGVIKTLAYLALSGSNSTLAELKIFDVSLPSGIYEVGSFNPSDSLYGTSITLLGDVAYLGRERATGSSKDLYMVDVSNPATPTELSSRKLGIASDTEVFGIAVQGNMAFVATSDNVKPLLVFDVTDPANPLAVSTCGLSSIPSVRDIVYHDNQIYSVSDDTNILHIIHDQASSCS